MKKPNQSANLYKPSWIFSMAVGSAVGWGSFVLPYDWIQQSGWLGASLGFTIGGAIITIIGLNYGVAIKCLPVSGGAVAHALSARGRLSGAIAGWSLALGYSSIVALNASAVPLIIRSLNPYSESGLRLYSIAGWDVYLSDVLVCSAFIVAFAVMANHGASISGRFQFIAVAAMISTVAILVVWSLAHCNFSEAFYRQALPDGQTLLVATGSVVAIAPWAYVGFDSIPQLAGEFSFPPKKARKLLVTGIMSATMIYIAMILVTAVLTVSDLEIYRNSAWAIADAVSGAFGPIGMLLLIVAVSSGIVTGLNGFFTASSRTLMTMGRARILPEVFSRQDGNRQVPTVSIYTVMCICLITPWFGRAALSWIVDMASIGITVAYFYTSLCVRKIGKTGFSFGMNERQPTSTKTRLLGDAGCIVSLAFLVLLFLPGAPSRLSPQALMALTIWIVIAIGMCTFRRNHILKTSDEVLANEIFNMHFSKPLSCTEEHR
ncbi:MULTISPECIES: APC family permease [unclassified Corynebacterium]|uniref:APC family permease n=1 Tax=unclassified Corynebacterium TaxID=2624378 RepID=UPI0009F3C51D|nr:MULTISPECIES: APC family permease [unclassified Corynebacterium]